MGGGKKVVFGGGEVERRVGREALRGAIKEGIWSTVGTKGRIGKKWCGLERREARGTERREV